MNNEQFFQTLWSNQQGQDITEYAVMLALILVLVVGTVRLVGSNANNAFSSVASCSEANMVAQPCSTSGSAFALHYCLTYSCQATHHADPNAQPHPPLHDTK